MVEHLQDLSETEMITEVGRFVTRHQDLVLECFGYPYAFTLEDNDENRKEVLNYIKSYLENYVDQFEWLIDQVEKRKRLRNNKGHDPHVHCTRVQDLINWKTAADREALRMQLLGEIIYPNSERNDGILNSIIHQDVREVTEHNAQDLVHLYGFPSNWKTLPKGTMTFGREKQSFYIQQYPIAEGSRPTDGFEQWILVRRCDGVFILVKNHLFDFHVVNHDGPNEIQQRGLLFEILAPSFPVYELR